jgi:hypothetical protein
MTTPNIDLSLFDAPPKNKPDPIAAMQASLRGRAETIAKTIAKQAVEAAAAATITSKTAPSEPAEAVRLTHEALREVHACVREAMACGKISLAGVANEAVSAALTAVGGLNSALARAAEVDELSRSKVAALEERLRDYESHSAAVRRNAERREDTLRAIIRPAPHSGDPAVEEKRWAWQAARVKASKATPGDLLECGEPARPAAAPETSPDLAKLRAAVAYWRQFRDIASITNTRRFELRPERMKYRYLGAISDGDLQALCDELVRDGFAVDLHRQSLGIYDVDKMRASSHIDP